MTEGNEIYLAAVRKLFPRFNRPFAEAIKTTSASGAIRFGSLLDTLIVTGVEMKFVSDEPMDDAFLSQLKSLWTHIELRKQAEIEKNPDLAQLYALVHKVNLADRQKGKRSPDGERT